MLCAIRVAGSTAALQREEGAFAIRAAGVAGDGAIGTEDAVTWDDDAHRVAPHGPADGARRGLHTETLL